MDTQQTTEQTVSIKKSTIWQLVSGVLGILLVVSIFTGGFGYGNNGGSGTLGVTGQAVGNQPTQPSDGGVPSNIKVSVDDDPVLGEKDAPVTIIEFSDFECPFCGRFYTQTEKQIIDEYINDGKVKLVYRDFPLTSIHPYAQKAAEAGECADEQGKFWDYHDLLFEKQGEWAASAGGTGVSQFKEYATTLKLDTKKFNECLDSGKYEEEVTKDSGDAVAAGGRGTPYFVFLNADGEVAGAVSGAQPYANFQAAIESTLAESN